LRRESEKRVHGYFQTEIAIEKGALRKQQMRNMGEVV
jgi:hypothetical protein